MFHDGQDPSYMGFISKLSKHIMGKTEGFLLKQMWIFSWFLLNNHTKPEVWRISYHGGWAKNSLSQISDNQW